MSVLKRGSHQHGFLRTHPAVMSALQVKLTQSFRSVCTTSTTDLSLPTGPEIVQKLTDAGNWMADVNLSTSFAVFPHDFPTGHFTNPRTDSPVARVSPASPAGLGSEILQNYGYFANKKSHYSGDSSNGLIAANIYTYSQCLAASFTEFLTNIPR